MSEDTPGRRDEAHHDVDQGGNDALTQAFTELLDLMPENTHDQEVLQPGRILGPYRLIRLLGQGGMGMVWLAEQSEPVVREVALKLVKARRLSSSGLARFEMERQMLAKMSHPAIAHVYDAGTTEQGYPWLAMEYVPGLPITEFCEEHRLSTRERLRLLIRVCLGVQHAHQKGILHRDLKPQNILVARVDDQPMPKIIDFGIAMTSQSGGRESIAGTPQYMSPEQADVSGSDIDTRSDIYSLGVVLFELLTSQPALPSELFVSREQSEIYKVLRDHGPLAPSGRLSETAGEAAIIAERQRTDVRELARRLRGELDWIVLRATDAKRERRYPSAQELALDLQRYLDHQPVSAVPAGNGYRLRKFIRRHRAGVGAAAIAVLALSGGLVASTWSMMQAHKARQQVEYHRAELAEVVAFQQRMIADLDPQAMGVGIIEVLTGQIEGDDPSATALRARLASVGGTEVARRVLIDQMLTPAAGALDEGRVSISFQPALRRTLGEAYQMAGALEQARHHYQQAWEQSKQVLGPLHPESLAKGHQLAGMMIELEELDQAEILLHEIVVDMERVLGDEAVETQFARRSMAELDLALGRPLAARSRLEQIRDVLTARLGADDEGVLSTRLALAMAMHASGEPRQALRESQAVFEILLDGVDQPGIEHVDTMAAHAYLLSEAGEIADSVALGTRVLELERQRRGARHPDVALALNNLASDLLDLENYDLAIAYFEEALDIVRLAYGERHQYSLVMMNNIAAAYTDMGETEKALALSAHVLEMTRETLGSDHPTTLLYEMNWSIDLRDAGRVDLAIEQLSATRQRMIDQIGNDHQTTLIATSRLISLLAREDRHEQALALSPGLLDDMQRVLGQKHLEFLDTALLIAELQLGQDRTEAQRIHNEYLAWILSTSEPELKERGLLRLHDDVEAFAADQLGGIE